MAEFSGCSRIRSGLAVEGLDGGLVVDHGHHDVAVVGGLLLTHDDEVAVHDPDLDHRLAHEPAG